MNNFDNLDINTIDWEDNPIFAQPQDHYFDPNDCYIDANDSYMLANIRAENARKYAPSSSSSSSSSGFGLGSLNFGKIFKFLAAILGIGVGLRVILFLITLIFVI